MSPKQAIHETELNAWDVNTFHRCPSKAFGQLGKAPGLILETS